MKLHRLHAALQLKPNKLPFMTKEERYRRLHEYGCIACRMFCGPWAWRAPQMHHIVNQSYREHKGGDRATLPLCPWHHQGHPDEGLQAEEMQIKYGPSLALESKLFHVTFGTEAGLLETIDKAIGAPPRAT